MEFKLWPNVVWAAAASYNAIGSTNTYIQIYFLKC